MRKKRPRQGDPRRGLLHRARGVLHPRGQGGRRGAGDRAHARERHGAQRAVPPVAAEALRRAQELRRVPPRQ